MAITRNFTSGSPPVADRVTSATPTILVTNAVAAGDLIVVAIVFEDSAITVTSITDTSTNTYVQAGTYQRDGASPSTSCIFYCLSAAAASGSTNTVTIHLSGSILVCAAVQSVTSPGATWALDQKTGATGTTGNPTSGSVTTTSASEYVVACAYGDSATCTASGSITPQYTHTPIGGLSFEASGDAILTSTTSINGTFTQNTSGQSSAFIATFAAISASVLPPSFPPNFPDAIAPRNYPVTQQLATTEISPKPIPPVIRTRKAYPGPGGLGSFLLFGANLDPVVPFGVQPSFPDRLPVVPTTAPLSLAAEWYPSTPTAPTQVSPVFQDKIFAPAQVALGMAVGAVFPERTSPYWDEWHPDRIDRPVFLTALQLPTLGLSPFPERTSAWWQASFPDRLPGSPFPVPEQVPTMDLSPKPERTGWWGQVFPDAVWRPALRPEEQQSLAFLTSERPLWWSVSFPDRIDRPVVLTSRQQFHTDLPSLPERTSPWWCSVFPDAVLRPFFSAAEQLDVTNLAPFPERNAPWWEVLVVDAVGRPFLHASEQLATYVPFPQTSVVTPIYFAGYAPERAPGVFFSAAEQLAFSRGGPQDRNAPMFPVIFPDRPDRATFATSEQQPVAYVTPERPTWWTTVFPDRPDRVTFQPDDQQAFPFVVEERAVDYFDPRFPDRVDRPSFRPEEQQFQPLVIRDRTTALAIVEFPARVDRLSLAPSDQQALAFVTLERNSPWWWEVHPDGVLRPTLRAEEQQALAFVTLERNVPFWNDAFPDRADRPSLGAHEQQAVFVAFPISAVVVPAYFVAYGPERIDRPSYPAARQLAHALGAPSERTSPLAAEWHPDRVDRPSLGAHLQQAHTEPPTRERDAPWWQSLFADRVDRPSFGAYEQQTRGAPTTLERSTWWSTSYPDRLDPRPSPQHPPISPFLFVQPPPPIPTFFSVGVWPDGVVRPLMLASQQRAWTTSPLPSPNSPPPNFGAARGYGTFDGPRPANVVIRRGPHGR